MTGRACRFLLAIVATLTLVGCGMPSLHLSDGEVKQTAEAQGCWPDSVKSTPLPVTVTVPGGSPTRTPTVVVNFGDPTHTPAPTGTSRATTTPMPRCTPQPGQTQVPWPTPMPTEPPFPTRPVSQSQPQAGSVDVMRLPNAVLVSDLAVHPNDSWPAVAAIDIPVENRADARVYVRVYNPRLKNWALAQTVDQDGAHPGDRFRSVKVSVGPDDSVHVIWGATTYPKMELFYSRSDDYGATWSDPISLGGQYFFVLDVVAAPNGEVYAIVLQPRGPQVVAVLMRRTTEGVWSKEDLPASPWYASSGALTVIGDGNDARLMAMVTSSTDRPGGAITLSRPLRGGAWTAQSHTTTDATGLLTSASVLTYAYRVGSQVRQGITFGAIPRDGDAKVMYSLTSLNGGVTWGRFARVATTRGLLTSGGIAFDGGAQRLVAIWNCCTDAAWGNAEATHYAAWASPADGVWSPPAEAVESQRSPLITGAKSAAVTMVAHSINAKIAWVAWVEDGLLVRARSYNLDRIIPRDQYPEPTAPALPTRTGGNP